MTQGNLRALTFATLALALVTLIQGDAIADYLDRMGFLGADWYYTIAWAVRTKLVLTGLALAALAFAYLWLSAKNSN